MENNKLLTIETTTFIWETNLSGDPTRAGKYPSDKRVANIVLPAFIAKELIEEGFNVKSITDEDDNTTYYIKATANYNAKYPPKIYLVSGDGVPVLLDESTVKEIDKIDVKNINVVLNKYQSPNSDKPTLYIRTMYVEQDFESDPFASRYARRKAVAAAQTASDEMGEDDLPF